MKTSVKTIIFATAVLLGVAVLLPGSDVMAQSDIIQDAVNDLGGGDSLELTSVIKLIIDVLLYFIGALSVVMIIYGGFKYVTSSGESSAVASAKNTILYAVIGLIVSVLAFGIVNFVIGLFDESSAGNGTQEAGNDVNTNSPAPAADGGNVDRDGNGDVRDR